jgi:hypothetical protein
VSEFDVLGSAAAGMEVQRTALDVAARNVAAAEAGAPGSFERLVPRFATAPPPGDDLPFPDPFAGLAAELDGDGDSAPVRFLGTSAERGVDPDAITEMVAVLDAQRAYEANAAVFDAGKRLAERTIEAGRP